MFRKIGPWYSKRFGPASEFNKRVVQIATRADFTAVLEHYFDWRRQFLDDSGELKPRFRPVPLVSSFMGEEHAQPSAIRVPKGPVEMW